MRSICCQGDGDGPSQKTWSEPEREKGGGFQKYRKITHRLWVRDQTQVECWSWHTSHYMQNECPIYMNFYFLESYILTRSIASYTRKTESVDNKMGEGMQCHMLHVTLKLPSLFQKQFQKSLKSILNCHSTSLSPFFIILDKDSFVKVCHYKWVFLKLGKSFLMKILQNGSQAPHNSSFSLYK